MEKNQLSLKNGLSTLFVKQPGCTASTVQFWFRTGSALENKQEHGIAHFLEHMFFKGTKKRPSGKIARDVESFGGEINAFTSFDYTCYYINAPNTNLLEAIDVLCDMVANPRFLEEELLPEREVVLEEYRRAQDSPSSYLFQQIQKNVFCGAYEHPILGNENSIKTFSLEQLETFRRKFYSTANALLIVAGDLEDKEKKEAIKIIEKEKFPSGIKSTFEKFELKKNSSTSVHARQVGTANLSICIEAPFALSPAAAAEDLAINCLAHGESSRLYDGLVCHSQLSSSASGSTLYLNKGGCHFLRFAFPLENRQRFYEELLHLLEKVLREGFGAKEIAKIKNQYLSQKVYEMESIESYAFSFGHGFAQYDDIQGDLRFLEAIKKTSSAEVFQGLKKLLAKPAHFNLQIATTVNTLQKKEEQKRLEILKRDWEKLSKIKTERSKDTLDKRKTKHSAFDPNAQIISIAPSVSLIYRRNKLSPTFVMQASLKGGLSEEAKKENGLYHLISAALLAGHGKVKENVLKEIFDFYSANISPFSGKNAYGLTLHAQSKDFDDLKDHFFGPWFSPNFANSAVKREKELAKRILLTHKEDPTRQCFHLVNQLMFGDHPYARSLYGSEASLAKLSSKMLKDRHQKNLRSQNLLFTYCGDMDIDELLPKIKAAIPVTYLKRRHLVKKIPKKINKIDRSYGKTLGLFFDREQTQIFYGIPTPKLESEEIIALKLLTQHLSGQSSELFTDVRDRKGLCYSVQVVHLPAIEAGYFGIYMASSTEKTSRAIEAIKTLIHRLEVSALSLEEFKAAKKMLRGQALLNVQTNEDYANAYTIPVLHGHGIDYYHLENQKIDDLNYQKFCTQIRKAFQRKWNLVVVGKNAKEY